MANYIMAMRYSDPFLPGLEEKFGHEILAPELPSKQQADDRGYRYLEPVMKLKGRAKVAIEKVREHEANNRMLYMGVIYIRKHNDKKKLEREYREELHEGLLTCDTILIEPSSVCHDVVQILDFGYYFYVACGLLSIGSMFVGKFYRHKTYTTFMLFVAGAILTVTYSNTYETWPIADFYMYPDALLVGAYCSPAVIFLQPEPIAIFRYYNRYDRIRFLYTANCLAGLQLLYRFYQGVPPYLCPCTSIHFPEFPRYASVIFYPVIITVGWSVLSLVKCVKHVLFSKS